MNRVKWIQILCQPILIFRVSECDQFYEWGEDTAAEGELEAASQYNISHYTSLCKIDGKRFDKYKDKYK